MKKAFKQSKAALLKTRLSGDNNIYLHDLQDFLLERQSQITKSEKFDQLLEALRELDRPLNWYDGEVRDYNQLAQDLDPLIQKVLAEIEI